MPDSVLKSWIFSGLTNTPASLLPTLSINSNASFILPVFGMLSVTLPSLILQGSKSASILIPLGFILPFNATVSD